MPASTAPLQALSSKLLKSRHCLHATNLQCEQGRTECEKSKQQVEKNDASISALEEQERKLKMQCEARGAHASHLTPQTPIPHVPTP
jgi:chromosome segregation ATPase